MFATVIVVVACPRCVRAMSIFGLIFEFRLDAAVGRNQVVSAKLGSVVVVDHPSAEAARHARATLL